MQEPLRKIQTFAGMLHDRYTRALNEKGNTYLYKIIESTRRSRVLINALLHFSFLNEPNEAVVATDLNKLLQAVLEDFKPLIRQKAAIINTSTLPEIDADPQQMKLLLYHLIDNALKFSREDVTPVIDISSKRLKPDETAFFAALGPHQDYIKIIIRDNGIGFWQHHAEKIFETFSVFIIKQITKERAWG